jgi:hypothetical protein
MLRAMSRCPEAHNPGNKSILLRCGSRNITQRDIAQIQQILADHPDWNRQQVSMHVCRVWNWRRSDGVLNHRTRRDLLTRLQGQGRIQLPGRKGPYRRRKFAHVAAAGEPPQEPISDLNLDRLLVRPIRLDERPQWRALMRQEHYLGFQSVVGESMCYVATIDDRWVALVAWGAAALKNRYREEWIGWDAALKWRRLHLVSNNTRFLILPGIRIKNLASKVLSANLRRLSRDWQERYGHPILLAETFVDVSRFAGTCYRASGWIPLGQTRGFARTGNGYQAHGKPKMLFVRPVHPHAQRMLGAAFSPPRIGHGKETIPAMDVNQLPIEGNDGLIDLLKTITDPRKRRGVRHPLVCILAIATCACLAGARSFEAIAQWAEELSPEALKRLGCKRSRPPSEKCFRLTLQRLDAAEFDRRLSSWLVRHNILADKGIALDGKTVRGAHDGDKAAPHLFAAVLHREGIIVAQQQVGEKTNEIPCVKPLLKDLDIEGAVVTADAMHTQKETARFLVEDKKAHYVFTVKDNQSTLRQDIADLGLEALPPSAR